MMKMLYIIVGLMIFAWPAYLLYQRQLGAIPFLLLAVFFMVIAIRQIKMLKRQNENDLLTTKKEKPKQKR